MKNLHLKLTVLFLLSSYVSFAQFGFVKKADVELMKDTRMVVVLNADSAYSAAIQAAVQRYWSFNTGYVFVSDTSLKPYLKKPDYSFLVFSKSKGSRIKAKVCTAENDINGVLLAKNYKRKISAADMVAIGYCSNTIDTIDWYPELVRGIQLLDFFLNHALQAKDDRAMSESFLMNNYPTDKGVMSSQTLLFEKRILDIKPTEDAAVLWDGEIDEQVNVEGIHEAILKQDPTKVYYYQVQDEKYCNKLVVSAQNSELMYFTSTGRDKCKLTSKDLKALKSIKDKASKL